MRAARLRKVVQTAAVAIAKAVVQSGGSGHLNDRVVLEILQTSIIIQEGENCLTHAN
jgi:hypothetical protein